MNFHSTSLDTNYPQITAVTRYFVPLLRRTNTSTIQPRQEQSSIKQSMILLFFSVLFVGKLTNSHPINREVEKTFSLFDNHGQERFESMKLILSTIMHYLKKIFVSDYSDLWNKQLFWFFSRVFLSAMRTDLMWHILRTTAKIYVPTEPQAFYSNHNTQSASENLIANTNSIRERATPRLIPTIHFRTIELCLERRHVGGRTLPTL